jgi:hypothetical protein
MGSLKNYNDSNAADHHNWFFTIETIWKLCLAARIPVLSVASVSQPYKKKGAFSRVIRGGLETLGLGAWIELVATSRKSGVQVQGVKS